MESPKKLTGQHPKERKMFELKINGKHTNNPVEVANAFNQHFIDSVAAIAQTFPPVSLKISQINTTEPAFNLQNVTETEVTQIIKSIKTSSNRCIWNGYIHVEGAWNNNGLPTYQTNQPIIHTGNMSKCLEVCCCYP